MSGSAKAVPAHRRRRRHSRLKTWQWLGPGLITGASDDDPSGIATYAQVGTIAFATAIGVATNFIGLNPIKALFWSAVLNGVIAVPLMVVSMMMATSPRVMGRFVLPRPLTVMGWLATAVMALIVAAMFLTWNQQG